MVHGEYYPLADVASALARHRIQYFSFKGSGSLLTVEYLTVGSD